MSGWFCRVSEGKNPHKSGVKAMAVSLSSSAGSTSLFALIFSAALTSSAAAETILWLGSPTGDWFSASNWYGYLRVPGTNDTANINSAGPTIAAGTSTDIYGLSLGINSEGTMSVNGHLSTVYGSFGEAVGATGKLNFSGGTWTNTSHIFVGGSGIGELYLSGSSATSSGHIYVGKDGTGYGTVKLDNSSRFENSGTVFVGNYGFGSLEVLGASVFETGGLLVGNGVGSIGTVAVEGARSSLTASQDMVVGGAGIGSLTITAGGAVTSKANTVIGNLSSGGLSIDGAGSRLETQGTLIVGNEGSATMSVGTAAIVTSGTVIIGRHSSGVVEVTGGDTRWTTGNLQIGGDAAANTAGGIGRGTLNVTTGGKMESVSARLGNSAGATGDVTVDGAGSVWTVGGGNLDVGVDGTGSVTVTGGGLVGSTDTVLGVNAGGSGSISISGSGSALRNSGDLYVGSAGQASLQIAASGSVSSNTGYVATLSGSRSSVTVAGGGSKWTIANALVIGYQNDAQGEVAVDAGGGIQAKQVTLGELAGSSGKLAIDGTGSNVAVEVENSLASSGSMTVGRYGSGYVTVQGGASLEANRLFLGTEAGSDGTLQVSGAGSKVEVATTLVIGGSGAGVVEVTGGASLAAATIFIASSGGSTGVLNIGAATGQMARSAGELEAEAIAFGSGNGSIVLNHSESNYELSANISGAGRIDAENGITTLSGNNSYSGGTTISAGTLKGTATSFGSGGIANNASLVVDGAGTLSNAISGSGSLEKTGNGNLILTGDSSYTGTTEVSSGKLSVNGSLASVISVADGATLGGSGTIGGATVRSGGTLAPGNSIGTLTSMGNVTFADASTYAVEIDSFGNSDRLAVTGTVTIANDVNLVITPSTGSLNFAFGAKYLILTATGGVTGAFSDVVGNLDYLKTAVTKSTDNNTVYLLMKRQSFGPGSFAASTSTVNARSAANAVEAAGEGSALYDAAFYLQLDEMQSAFSQLAGELHPSLAMALINRSQLTRDVILGRLRSAFGGVDGRPILPAAGVAAASDPLNIDEGLTFWSNGFGSRGRIDRDGNGTSADMKGGGVLFGLDGDWGEGWRAGVAAGYGRDAIEQKSLSASADVDSYYVSAYAGGAIGPASLRLGAIHAFQDVETRRAISFSTLKENLTAGYDASTTQVFAEAAWRFDLDITRIEPYANISYVNTRTDAFSEKGGIAAVSSGSASRDQLYTTLGTRISRDIAFEGTFGQAMFDIGWRHAYGDSSLESALFYVGGGAFTVASTATSRDVALLNLGLRYDLNPSATLTFRYGAVFGADLLDQTASAELGVRF
ncbi:hypothetical protein Agau_L300539 [Agrobacterium tumefaciens F2]|jgi:outer membrane autotransporter protein|nr:hypothetical protein Agau_L300539 [Agrobacterium tumefaciens F2]